MYSTVFGIFRQYVYCIANNILYVCIYFKIRTVGLFNLVLFVKFFEILSVKFLIFFSNNKYNYALVTLFYCEI
jgi:hypothetical protein